MRLPRHSRLAGSLVPVVALLICEAQATEESDILQKLSALASQTVPAAAKPSATAAASPADADAALVAKLAALAQADAARSAGKTRAAHPGRSEVSRQPLLDKLRASAAQARATGARSKPPSRVAGKPLAVLQAAMATALGQSPSGSITQSGEQIYYAFDGTAGDVIDISLTSPDFDTYLELRYGGEAIAVNDDGGEGLNSLLDDFVLPATGEYTVVVRSFGNDTGAFDLSLTLEGNAFVFAGAITPGTQTGELTVGGQIVLYSFALDEVSQVSIDLTSSDFDTYLELYEGDSLDDRTDDTRLARNDDGGEDTNSRLELSLGIGSYLIEARGFSSYSTGAFELALEVVSFGGDEDGAELSYGDAFTGGLYPEGDADSFTFAGEAGDVVDIALDSGDFDPVLELSVSGEVVAFDDDGGVGYNSRLSEFVLPVTGTYAISVRGYHSDAAGAYSLSLDQVESPFVFAGEAELGGTSGELASPGQIILYVLVVDASAELQVDLVSEDFDAFLVLYSGGDLSDRSAANRIAADDDGGEGLNSRLSQVVGVGDYLIEVRSYSDVSSGAYELTVALDALPGDEDATGPLLLALGDIAEGKVLPAGDVDEYVFDGAAGDVVNISLTSPDFDTFLELELDGVLIASNDDGGEGLNSLLEGFVLPASGQYVVLARPLSSYSTGAYEVSLTDVTPTLSMEAELAAGSVSGSITASGGIHLYPISVPAPTSLRIDLVSSDFDAFLVLYVGDAAADRQPENVVEADDDGGIGLNSRIEVVVPAGAYLLEARPLAAGVGGDYTIEVESTALAADEDADQPVGLSYGEALTGSLDLAGDRDEYAFVGDAGDVVDISVSSLDLDPYVELYFGGELLATDDDGGADLDALLEAVILPNSGQYVVRVRVLSNDEAGEYIVSVEDVTPVASLLATISAGPQSGAITEAGELHLYPFELTERSEVVVDVVASGFNPYATLYAGDGPEDRTAANTLREDDDGGGGQNARVRAILPAGTYLVEVRASDPASAQAGSYGLELKIQAAPRTHSTMTLHSGTLNGMAVNTFSPAVSVEVGEKIAGALSVQVSNSELGSEVFPVGGTASWGEAQSSYWEIADWAPAGNTSYDVSLDVTAPEQAGTYYLFLAGAAEPTLANIMSGTHWESGDEEIWDNGDEVALWDSATVAHVLANGWADVTWYSEHAAAVAAVAIRVDVTAAEGGALRGPIVMDLDASAGDQGVRRVTVGGAGSQVAVQLYAEDAPLISGWSIRLAYDPDQVLYVSDSFQPGDFIPGLVPLVAPGEAQVEVGGTVLGSGASNSGDGYLGSLSFEVQEGLVFSADLVINQVTLRTVEEGRVKAEVRSRATVTAASDEPEGPVAIDLDPAAGDQGARRRERARAGDTVEVELYIAEAPAISGWSARLEYDAELVQFEAGSFAPSSFITGLIPLVGTKDARVDVGGTVLGTATTGSGDGLLGQLTFTLTESFTDSAEITITQVRLNTEESGEVVEAVRHTVVIAAGSSGLPGDFNSDGVVDFGDFFLFADHFGLEAGMESWDPAYDFNSDGIVDFSDFFSFADTFGSEAQAKLMALARVHIGLPAALQLEQNYPNPFNHSTAIVFHLPRPAEVSLVVYDITGQRARVLQRGALGAGAHRVSWDGQDQQGGQVASGAYILRLATPDGVAVRRMMFVK